MKLAIKNQPARTENGMAALQSTANKCVDLFFKIGASRGRNVTPDFVAALVEDEDRAIRILQWARDVRGGAGERKIFRDLLMYLGNNYPNIAIKLLPKVPVLGRWDDLLELIGTPIEGNALELIYAALSNGDKLCAKWMPRQGYIAAHVRKQFGLTPKQWRKWLVKNTEVVETKMCNKQWEDINFEHVPSLAHARYKKAFIRNSQSYKQYLEALTKGEAKIAAGAVYPYDVLKTVFRGRAGVDEQKAILAQWKALPDYLGDHSILPLIDTSGSMGGCHINANLNVLEVAVSLGLYVSDKLKGSFKDCILWFAQKPYLRVLEGNVLQKYEQMRHNPWMGNTDLHAAMDAIVNTAVANKVPQSDMPNTLLIISDMQFDACVVHNDTAQQMIERKFADAGYKVPNVVYWNMAARDNVPTSFNKYGTALISGFSPSILKAVLADKISSPLEVMDSAIMIDRYAI